MSDSIGIISFVNHFFFCFQAYEFFKFIFFNHFKIYYFTLRKFTLFFLIQSDDGKSTSHQCLYFSKKIQYKSHQPGVPVMAQRKRIGLGTMKLWVGSLASLSGLRIPHCSELWCRSQTQLGSDVAVAVVQAHCCSSDWNPSL